VKWRRVLVGEPVFRRTMRWRDTSGATAIATDREVAEPWP
jgi:hypothetical protein